MLKRELFTLKKTLNNTQTVKNNMSNYNQPVRYFFEYNIIPHIHI